MNKKYSYTEEKLRQAIINSLSIAQVCKLLNIVPAGGNYKTLQFKIKELKIDVSHFTRSAWNKGIRFRNFAKRISLEEMLVNNSNHNALDIKNKLLDKGIKQYKCENCELNEWLGNKIPLELHHINGNKFDNRLENLQCLCPNCHSLTDNYRGRNKKSA